MMIYKFQIKQFLFLQSPAERKETRQKMKQILGDTGDAWLSTVINTKINEPFDFPFLTAYRLAQLFEVDPIQLYNANVLELDKQDNTKNIVS